MGRYYILPDYVSHHGIKGQKWGVRRYQNADGSLTAEGRRRYANTDEGRRFASVSKQYSSSKTGTNFYGSKDIKDRGISEKAKLLSAKGNSVVDSFDTMSKAADADYKSLRGNKKFYSEVQKAALSEFGGRKPKSFEMEMAIDDAFDTIAPKYMKNFQKASSDFDKKVNDFYDSGKKYSDELVGAFKNEKLTSSSWTYNSIIPKKVSQTVSYYNVISDALFTGANGQMTHYLANHKEASYLDSDERAALQNDLLESMR